MYTKSNLVGKSITDSGLLQQDINILDISRGDKVIPNPKDSRILEPGDKLLCFGKLESMRALVPASTRRKRKPKIKQLNDQS